MKKALLAVAALAWLSTPTQAQIPTSVFQFGGIYTTSNHLPTNPNPCRYPNPFTNACSCPAGFTARQIWEWHTNCAGGFYSDGIPGATVCQVNMFQCVK